MVDMFCRGGQKTVNNLLYKWADTAFSALKTTFDTVIPINVWHMPKLNAKPNNQFPHYSSPKQTSVHVKNKTAMLIQ